MEKNNPKCIKIVAPGKISCKLTGSPSVNKVFFII